MGETRPGLSIRMYESRSHVFEAVYVLEDVRKRIGQYSLRTMLSPVARSLFSQPDRSDRWEYELNSGDYMYKWSVSNNGYSNKSYWDTNRAARVSSLPLYEHSTQWLTINDKIDELVACKSSRRGPGRRLPAGTWRFPLPPTPLALAPRFELPVPSSSSVAVQAVRPGGAD